MIPISSAPGVQRDGTLFDSKAYTDARWCRFYRGKPKKMAGYRELRNDYPEPARGMHIDTIGSLVYTFIGSQSYVQRATIDLSTFSATTSFIDRTPVGFNANINNLWQFDSAFDVGTTAEYVLAHAAPNGRYIASDVARPLYYGDITAATPLAAVASSDVSGGVVVLHPYTIIFGSNGYLAWSVANTPTDFTGVGSGAARVCAHKIVRGLPLRAGPGNAPAGLFWGLETLSRLMYVGGSSVFSYDTISTSSSVLSAASIIEHNGVYYWPSNGGFLMFNGVLQPVPNTYNKAWFYKNLNMTAAQKSFATKIPMWDEIWWCFPKGASTECNHAVIYNYVDNFWYDTPLPDSGRSSAYFQQVYPYLLMMDAGRNNFDAYSLWQHEVGLDKVILSPYQTQAIRSSFRTNQITLLNANPPQDREISVQIVEPDFNQVGDMTMNLYGAANAADKTPSLLASIPVPEPVSGASNEIPGVSVEQRLLEFEFESNVAGGDFEMGRVLAHIEEGGRRRTT